MVFKIKKYKWIVLIVFLLFFIFVGVVYSSIDYWSDGYRVNHLSQKEVYHGNANGTAKEAYDCHIVTNNNSSNDYFVPTKTTTEWNAFTSSLPANVAVEGCPIFGSEYVFYSTGSTPEIYSAALDSTHFVLVFRDCNNNNFGTAMIGTTNGSAISFSPKFVFNSGVSSLLDIVILNSNSFVVSFMDSSANYSHKAVVGTVSGSNISFGSSYMFRANGSYQDKPSISKLDTSHFVVTYPKDSGKIGIARVGTVSGYIISYGPEYIFHNYSTEYPDVVALDSNHFVVSYRHVNKNIVGSDGFYEAYSAAKVGTVSGSAISFGAEYVFYPLLSQYFKIEKLDSTHFLIMFENTYTKYYSLRHTSVIVGSTSGSNISFGPLSVILERGSSSYNNGIAILDSTHFVASFPYGVDNPPKGIVKFGTINGLNISFSKEFVFNLSGTGATDYLNVTNLEPSRFVISFIDYLNSEFPPSYPFVLSSKSIIGKIYEYVSLP